MKATKFIVLSAGLIGLIGFFLPLIAVQVQGVTGAVSAFNVVAGIEAGQEELDKQVEANKDLLDDKTKAVAKEAGELGGTIKMVILLAYSPALLCFLFGLIGVLKKSFGRGLAFGSLIFGLITFGLWAMLNSAAGDAAAAGGDVKGVGMWVMLLSGLGCTIGGLMGLIKPDRGDTPTTSHPRHAATIKA